MLNNTIPAGYFVGITDAESDFAHLRVPNDDLSFERKNIMSPDPELIDESSELRKTEINKYDFKTESHAVFKARKGIDAEIVNQISDIKNEPDWMRKFRLDSLKIFEEKPMPKWGGAIDLDFQDIFLLPQAD